MSSIRRSFLLLANDGFADPLMSALVISAHCDMSTHVRFTPESGHSSA
jgi:hypothetical protein